VPRKLTFPPYPRRPHGTTGKARITVQREQIYLGPFGSPESWEQYEQELARWRARPKLTEADTQPRPTAPTVAEVAAGFAAHAQAHYSERGREVGQFALVLTPLVRLFGELPAARFRTAELEQLQLALASGSWMTAAEQERHRRRGLLVGLSRNVVNRRIVRVRTVWRWAERKGLVPAGSYEHLRTVPGLRRNARNVRVRPKVQPASWEAVKAVARAAEPAPRTMLLLQWWTGMRSAEVRAMRTADIDQAGPRVDGRTIWLYRPAAHKGDWREEAEESPRVVPLGPKCQALLRAWLRPDAPAAHMFAPRRRRRHPCYTVCSYAQAVRRAARRAGHPGFHAYQCRHAAKVRVTRAAGADAARAILGHRSIQTTQMYGSLDVAHAVEVARRLG